MDKHQHLPQFGNWESGEDVPYTEYFEKARKGRTGEKINPKDPQDKVDMSQNVQKAHPHPSKNNDPTLDVAERKPHEHRSNKDVVQNDNSTPRTAGEPSPRRSPRHNVGFVHGIERSPLHPHYPRTGIKDSGMSSPSREGKSSHDGSHGTGGRSRMKHAASDDNLDKSAAVPKFGEWDENNPASADGYTHIFNKVREERHAGGTKVSGATSPSYKGGKRIGSGSQKGCCFPWRGK